MPDPGSPETLDERAETSDDDLENTAEPVAHSSNSHWKWRPEYEVPPPEPGDPVMARRRIVAKRPPTDDEEEMRQKRLRSEPVPELFPLSGEELTENVFEILIDLFASPEPDNCEDSVYRMVQMVQNIVKISVYQLVQNCVKVPVFRKLMCTRWTEIVSDH